MTIQQRRSKSTHLPISRIPAGWRKGGLYALVDDGLRPEISLPRKAEAALRGGARIIQLRLKNCLTRDALHVARTVKAMCLEVDAACILNDRVDWALVAQLDGVHLGTTDISVRDARRVLGPYALIGATVRGLEEVHESREQGASYVGVGPVFPTRTKQVDAPVLGTQKLREICDGSPLPVVAVGGISLETLPQVARCRPHAVAMAGDWLLAEDMESRVAQLCRMLAVEASRH